MVTATIANVAMANRDQPRNRISDDSDQVLWNMFLIKKCWGFVYYNGVFQELKQIFIHMIIFIWSNKGLQINGYNIEFSISEKTFNSIISVYTQYESIVKLVKSQRETTFFYNLYTFIRFELLLVIPIWLKIIGLNKSLYLRKLIYIIIH